MKPKSAVLGLEGAILAILPRLEKDVGEALVIVVYGDETGFARPVEGTQSNNDLLGYPTVTFSSVAGIVNALERL